MLSAARSALRALWSRGHQRSVRARRNILGSLAVKGGNIAVGLMLVPLTIHYLQPTEYGVWITLSSIVAWFSFFDIGFGNGLRNKFAEAVSRGDHAMARMYLSTTYAVLLIIVAALLLVFGLVNPLLDWQAILNAPGVSAAKLQSLALIVFVFFCLQFVLQLLSAVITARQQPALAALLGFLGSLLSLLVVYGLTRSTAGNLQALAVALGACPVLVLALSSLLLYRSSYAAYAPSWRHVRLCSARELASLGGKFFVIQIAAVLLYQTSNLIIAQLFGPADVAAYNVAFRYFALVTMLMSIVTTPYWSAFTEAWAKEDRAWIAQAMQGLLRTWLGFSLLALLMVPAAPVVYRHWIGQELDIPMGLSAALAAYVIVNGWNGIYSQFLNGVGKVGLQLYVAVAGSLLNVPLAIVLGRQWGVAGVVASTVLVSLLSAGLAPLQYRRIVQGSARGIWAA